jgi:hypothetical protein
LKIKLSNHLINNPIMKKVSLLTTVLALMFVSSSVFAQFTQSQMIAEWQRAKLYTKAYLDAMPEDGTVLNQRRRSARLRSKCFI